MVVRLRLARHGTRNNPFYHVVAINDSKPRDARPIEKLGEYDPIPRPIAVASIARAPHTPLVHGKGKGKAKEASEGYGKVMTSGLNVETKLQKRIEWNEARIKYWLGTGAQPSKPVARLLHRAGLVPAGVFYKGMPPQTASTSLTTTGDSSRPSTKSTPATSTSTSAILQAVGATKSATPGSPAATALKNAKERHNLKSPSLSGESTMDQAS